MAINKIKKLITGSANGIPLIPRVCGVIGRGFWSVSLSSRDSRRGSWEEGIVGASPRCFRPILHGAKGAVARSVGGVVHAPRVSGGFSLWLWETRHRAVHGQEGSRYPWMTSSRSWESQGRSTGVSLDRGLASHCG